MSKLQVTNPGKAAPSIRGTATFGVATIGAIPGMAMAVGVGAGRIVLVGVAVILVKRFLLVEDAALLGALALQELVVHGPFLPGHLLLRAGEAEDQGSLAAGGVSWARAGVFERQSGGRGGGGGMR